MIDREQNLRLGDARKLSQMMQGESVPSSGLSKQMAEELGREATLEELSERMKLPSDEIRDIMKMTLDAMSVTGES